MEKEIDMSQFIETLQPFLQEAWKKAGFNEPTAIQTKAISEILANKDVIGESPTGTGKTLAYLLPVLHCIQPGPSHIQAVILASSHELVMQIHGEIQTWSQGSGISSAAFIGGANMKRQLEKLKKRPNIIVGTPGRLNELIKMKKLKMHEVKTIVIDEADQLFVPEHVQTVQQIVKMALSDRQILVFSATVSERTKSLAKDMMNHPLEIEVGRDELPASKVEHVYIKSEARDKVDVLRKLVRQEQMKALAFFKGIDTLIEFEEKLTFKRVEAGSLHSETKKEDRATTIKGFRKGDFPVLLATDVAARGLDIKGLTHVIHIDVPQDADQYVHRSGRTGRSGAEGTVISLVTEREERNLKQIARELQLSLVKKELYMGEIVDEGTKEQSRTAKKPSKKPFNKKKKQKGRM